jgi:hypothetical protein
VRSHAPSHASTGTPIIVRARSYILGFFWWLDLIAAVSLLLDIAVVRSEFFGDNDAGAFGSLDSVLDNHGFAH